MHTPIRNSIRDSRVAATRTVARVKNQRDLFGTALARQMPEKREGHELLSVRIRLANVHVTRRHAKMFPVFNWFCPSHQVVNLD